MSASIAAELAVTADHLNRYRDRIAAMATALGSGRNDDAVAAIYEAERSLRTAHRLLERAASLLGN